MLERFVIGTIYRSAVAAARDGNGGVEDIDRNAFDRAARGIIRALVTAPVDAR